MDRGIKEQYWLDWQVFIWIPLAIITLKDTIKNWRVIFDNDLSMFDRAQLQRINAFFITPFVVFLHECGHAVATLWAGGTVKEFHFGVFWGYVTSVGNFSPEQDFIINLAGSGVQVAIGFLMLLAAVILRSPPMVALMVYSGLSAIAGTIIIYTGLSFIGVYGDWIQIYRAPLPEWVTITGTVHVVLVGFLLYLFYGFYPKLWFSAKTRPKWYKDYLRAKEIVAKDPSAVNYLNLAWTFYLVGFEKEAQKTVDLVAQKDPNNLDRYMLAGWLKQDKGKTPEAVELFEKIADSPSASSVQKCRALMAIGHSLDQDAARRAPRGANPTKEDLMPVIASYEQAHAAEPAVADPRFYKASVLNKLGLHKEAEDELKDLQGAKWLDPALSELFRIELQVARKSDKG